MSHKPAGRVVRSLVSAVAGAVALLLPLGVLAPASGTPADRAPAAPSRTVPAPTSTTSVVTVKVGGDRNGDQSTAPLAGTTLGLYAGPTGGAPEFTCVSDADGDCSFQVTGTGTGGANRAKRYWVRQIAAPSGWYANESFRTGGTSTTPYRFQTPALYGGTTYSSTDSGSNGFMVGSGASNLSASSGTWQQSRDNPVLPEKCGLRVALVMDLSGSMQGSVGALKTAADTFVDALQGTPSSMARFTFSTYSPAVRAGADAPGLQSVSTRADAAAFKQQYAGWNDSTANGSTNWDRALYEPALAANDYDVAVVITDGMPTRYSTPEGPGGNGTLTRVRELENGIYSANALKKKGTRVLAVGVGAGTTGNASLNLASLSGQTRYDGTNVKEADYYQEASFESAGRALRDLALAPCTPTLSVVKQIQAEDGTLYNAPAGWTFDADVATPDVSVESPRTTTNDGTGAVNFPLTYGETVTEADVGVTERQQPGYTLIQQGGKNAECTDKVSEQPVEVTDDPGGGPGFRVDVPAAGSVTCTVLNKAPDTVEPASVKVAKEWAVTTGDGTRTYPEGQQPSDLRAALSLTGPGGSGASTQGWSTTREGYTAGERVTLSEAPSLAPQLNCRLTRVELDGNALDPDDPTQDVTLAAGLNEHTLTNHVTCQTTLTLAKRVQGGDADPANWTLRGYGASGALPGPEGTHGSPGATANVTPGARYQLAEELNSADPALLNYRQVDNRTDYQSNPRSTGSMNCLAYDREGNEVLGWNDGINGGVNVTFGMRAVCSAVNETVPLTLAKKVAGGDADPGEWNLTATPVDPDPAGVPAQTVKGAPGPEGATLFVRPGQRYRITESGGPATHELTDVSCSIEDGARGDGSVLITVGSGQRGSCVLTNTYRPSRLTLDKRVVNDDGGTAKPRDWTLTAAGSGQTLTGRAGDPSVTGARVAPGGYTLSEDRRPGYRATPWACADSSGAPVRVTDSRVEIARGAQVTCRVTNHDTARPTPTPTPTPTTPPHPAPDRPSLPDTGQQLTWFALGGLALLAAGAWLYRRSRRRA